jgi:hypothetical protein
MNLSNGQEMPDTSVGQIVGGQGENRYFNSN